MLPVEKVEVYIPVQPLPRGRASSEVLRFFLRPTSLVPSGLHHCCNGARIASLWYCMTFGTPNQHGILGTSVSLCETWASLCSINNFLLRRLVQQQEVSVEHSNAQHSKRITDTNIKAQYQYTQVMYEMRVRRTPGKKEEGERKSLVIGGGGNRVGAAVLGSHGSRRKGLGVNSCTMEVQSLEAR